MTGRIDVHSHLIPGVDDGCRTVEQSIECARMLAGAGYTHVFCTPHVWPNYPHVTRENVRRWTDILQLELRTANIPITLLPGGELNLSPATLRNDPDHIIPLALGNQFILTDIWADLIPSFFEPTIRWLQDMKLTVILAHPERCRAVQDHPEIAEWLAKIGVLLQGNLQCFADPPEALTRRIAERYLRERRYFLLGSDTHNPEGLPGRLTGLQNAIALAGEAVINQLTIENPRQLLPT
jgi:protein-tyrosine phosphatase